MNRALLILTVVLCAAALPVRGQEVAEGELRSVDREVVFLNYEGPYDRIDSADEIKGLGYYLAASLRADGRRGAFLLKYSIIRAIDPRSAAGFDADVFSIDADAKVDHIDNVRRILAGYLEGAFRYSAEDARTLARFATIYNAVFRGNLEYLGSRYKGVVLQHLSRENAGLSTKYFEWPGATRLLVPLGPGAGEGVLSSLSTSELTEPRVIEDMRRQPDMGLEDRKDMVELKEREVQQQQQELEQAQERVQEAREGLADSQQKVEEARTAAEKEKARSEVAAKEAEVKAAEAEVKAVEAQIESKQAEIEKERELIVSDERSRDERAAAALSDRLYYLKVTGRESSGSFAGTLSVLDPAGPAVQLTSPVRPVRGRAFHFFENTILVIADGAAGGPARLVLLDPANLQEIRSSAEEVYGDSFVLLQGGAVYAVIRSPDGRFRLGRFDRDLRLTVASAEAVDRDSAFVVFGERLYVNSEGRDILALGRDSLQREGLIR